MLRFDSSSRIGLGHAVRSLALAEHLLERGLEVHVLTRRLHGSLARDRVDPRVVWHELPAVSEPLGAHPWSVDEVSDARATNQILGGLGTASWIVVDHYGLGAEWERAVRGNGAQVAAIDDLRREHYADLVVNPNVEYDQTGLQADVLSGPRFAMLRSEFVALRHDRRPDPERVLLFLGGSDINGRSLDVAKAINQECPNVDLDVVVTAGSTARESLERLAASSDRVTVSTDVEDMAARMCAATLMVGAAGSTSWERACVGLPSVFVTTAENQRDIAKTVASSRAGLSLGSAEEVTATEIASVVRRVLGKPGLLARMSRRAHSLCDGRGVDRVAAALGVPLRVSILSDTASWLNPRLRDLASELEEVGHQVSHVHEPDSLMTGDLALILGCGTLVTPRHLAKHAHNLVVHESDLPDGRGWSPMTWQLLDDRSQVVVTLFEAVEALDAGPIYAQTVVNFEGHELVDEIRHLQAEATLSLCRDFVNGYPRSIVGSRPQQGLPSYYPRRTPADSRVGAEQTLNEIFPMLRVADNDRYPVFFEYRGHRYRLHIEKIHD